MLRAFPRAPPDAPKTGQDPFSSFHSASAALKPAGELLDPALLARPVDRSFADGLEHHARLGRRLIALLVLK